MRCPLCGHGETFAHPACADLIVCAGCGETLRPAELVRRATRKTRRVYLASNPESDPGRGTK